MRSSNFEIALSKDMKGTYALALSKPGWMFELFIGELIFHKVRSTSLALRIYPKRKIGKISRKGGKEYHPQFDYQGIGLLPLGLLEMKMRR